MKKINLETALAIALISASTAVMGANHAAAPDEGGLSQTTLPESGNRELVGAIAAHLKALKEARTNNADFVSPLSGVLSDMARLCQGIIALKPDNQALQDEAQEVQFMCLKLARMVGLGTSSQQDLSKEQDVLEEAVKRMAIAALR